MHIIPVMPLYRNREHDGAIVPEVAISKISFGCTSQGPISRVPPELLHHIFPYSLPIGVVTPSTSKPPLVLGYICRSWRRASVECHAIWSTINVGMSHCFLEESCIAGVELWLSRSGNLPLTIQFRPGNLPPQIHDGLLQVICKYTSRWSAISLDLKS